MTTKAINFRTPQASRAAALALLAIAVLLAVAAIAVPAWLLYQRYVQTQAQLSRQLSSYTALNELRPKLMRAVETLKTRDTRKYFLKGATPALAGADLQDVVRALIEANNGRLLSSQLLPHRDETGYRSVHAKLQISANIQNLRQILHGIESREPFLFVDQLLVRAQVPGDFKPQPGFEPEMFVQFDVSGLVPISAEENSNAKPKAGAAAGATAKGAS
jgi:general secretion pathway protein M